MSASDPPFPTFSSSSLPFVEELYRDYLNDPASVPAQWSAYFRELGPGDATAVRASRGATFRPSSIFRPAGRAGRLTAEHRAAVTVLQDRADQLVRAYRVRGHLAAKLDPLGLPRAPVPELDPAFYGFGPEDLPRICSQESIPGVDAAPLGEILAHLSATYCRSIGVQFMHIDDLSVRAWLQKRVEGTANHVTLTREEQLRILTSLTDAVLFEEFIQKKFVGAKSFSLEGAESLIPLLETAIDTAGEQGIVEIVLGMAHRGRLNVLANVMGKSPRQIFREFDDAAVDDQAVAGDVKYHLGYHSEWTTATGRKLQLSLCFNPSHLEFVNPVALGRLRARQDRHGDPQRRRGMTILIHGDAAFAGEGIVQETLNLSELPGYTTGGALHVIVNNQLGFTTPPEQGRSSTYASDVAKMLQVPILHVNGEDPEAVAQVVRVALDFRETFRRDVVIDMYGYRRRGHNEGDEPAFTQPLMYAAIARRKGVREGYLEHLLKLGGVTQAEADDIARARREYLEAELSAARSPAFVPAPDSAGFVWQTYLGGPESGVADTDTGVNRDELVRLMENIARVPAGFHPHPKSERLLAQRREMARGERPLDWAAAEALALASLAAQGHRVRLTGQDSERGTFSQRHAVLHDIVDGSTHPVLQHATPGQAPVEIHNSPLSEAGVLGFEYGYSLDAPGALVLWEAQFGDFVNAGQVIIDQFIASAEEKWRRLSGLVLLLPHGFEGLGPEHSSARLERFLNLGVNDNLQVANPTTPAQYFHLLRRQVVRPWRKPLIVMTPKSLLRHPAAVSTLDELATGRFARILPDAPTVAPAGVRRLLLCSGKLAYELLEAREATGRKDVAILRVEQLYPLPDEVFAAALAPYATTVPVVWVQEEPENMGAWRHWCVRFGERLHGRPFTAITRPAAASPATGSLSFHRQQQQSLIERALDPAPVR